MRADETPAQAARRIVDRVLLEHADRGEAWAAELLRERREERWAATVAAMRGAGEVLGSALRRQAELATAMVEGLRAALRAGDEEDADG